MEFLENEDELGDQAKEASSRARLPPFVLNPHSTFIKCWNGIMIFLLVYTLLVLPPRLAFDDETNINWFYADIITDCLFFVDIIINFMLAYEDQNGVLVVDRKKIFLNYLKGLIFSPQIRAFAESATKARQFLG